MYIVSTNIFLKLSFISESIISKLEKNSDFVYSSIGFLNHFGPSHHLFWTKTTVIQAFKDRSSGFYCPNIKYHFESALNERISDTGLETKRCLTFNYLYPIKCICQISSVKDGIVIHSDLKRLRREIISIKATQLLT